MRPEDDPEWEAYRHTVLKFQSRPPIEIDLARPVTADQREALARIGLRECGGLVTPCNPRGQRCDSRENAVRLERFLAELDAQGARYTRVDGCSPDGCHIEPGVALPWPQSDVLDLARRWDQSAVYWWDGAVFWVVGALTHAPPQLLGSS